MAMTPDYVVSVVTEDGQDLFSLDLKIKHSRQMTPNGRAPSQYGGQTVIFEQNTNTVFSSRCRMSEQFSRRKGLMTCLQKLLHQIPFRGLDDGMVVYVGTAEEGYKSTWL